MEFREYVIPGLVLIEPRVFADERGFFLERYNRRIFQEHGIHIDFVQDNHSHSIGRVLRGLHFQIPPFAQDKLVWAIQGEVFDVAVDLRKGSPSYGKWAGVILSGENKRMLLIPKGFAHGFVALSPTVDFIYKTSNFYSAAHDRGLIWNDPDLAIAWPVSDPILSEKDRRLPALRSLSDSDLF
ncbi:MAG: dTDP-4-dehydrorhamnose 3,5-epimerase [Anaerolineae bacterium]|nr:dTDP-4-dehydrorhamnose 3,5-epimerase [Anaerolineae bacterium]